MENPPSSPKEPISKKLKMSTTSSDGDEETEAAVDAVAGGPTARNPLRYKRRKVAIFFAYCGVGYQGMQKNPGAKTIEGDLEEALYDSSAIPEQDRGYPKRFDWARSARTDKGVSAVGQVVSGRFYVDPPGLVDRLNSNLPSQIRIFGYKRVTASFDAKKFCDRRRYVYLLPVFALDPSAHPDRESVLASLGSENELVKCLECSERGRKVIGLMGKRIFSDASPTGVNDSVSNCNFLSDISSNSGAATLAADCNETMSVHCSKDADVSKYKSSDDASLVISDAKTELGLCLNPEAGLSTAELREQFDISSDSNKSVEIVVKKMVSEPQAASGEERSKGELHGSQEAANNMDSVIASLGAEDGNLDSHTSSAFVVKRSENDQLEMNGCASVVEKMAKKSGFIYGGDEKERFNRILKQYEGTHNFHNFTTRTKAEDPSARRFIVSFDANTMVTVEGIDFVKCEVVGQSFMLHQIRKMIGLAVAIMRNRASESLLKLYSSSKAELNHPLFYLILSTYCMLLISKFLLVSFTVLGMSISMFQRLLRLAYTWTSVCLRHTTIGGKILMRSCL
ncbi:hypothetical protein Dimus_006303 [Dionaea muscipula]